MLEPIAILPVSRFALMSGGDEREKAYIIRGVLGLAKDWARYIVPH